jgi:beta-N-acetylhexosaminidase
MNKILSAKRFLPKAYAVLATVILLFSQATSVSALSSEQQRLLHENINYFDICGGQSSDTPTDSSAQSAPGAPAQNSTPLALPASYTLKDKIGQLLFVGLTDSSQAADLEKKYHIGGFLLDTGATYTKSAIDPIKSAGDIPPLIAVDEEGGKVDRLNLNAPSAKQMGQMSDDQVKQKAADIAGKLSDAGITVDFAPVVDLDNGKNAAISQTDRSFSSNPSVVSSKAGAFADGLQQSSVIPTFKHFPGLGNADGPSGGNTDTAPATTPSLSSLQANDLKPYESLLSRQQAMVMMGNQTVPGLTNGQPASLSKDAYDLLRGKYGFAGVVVTDEIGHAKAIHASTSQAVISALQAGADMPLFTADSPGQVGSVVDDVAQAVKNNSLPETSINAALNRILQLKNSQAGGKPAGSAQCGCSSGVAVSGNTPAAQAFNYFVNNAHLSPQAAAGIVGNMETESAGNTEKLDTHAHNDIAGGHDGIIQWDGGRWANLKSHESGKNIYDITTQLDYVWYELQGSYKQVLGDLKNADSAAKAATIFNNGDEVSGDNSGQREANATKLFNKYGGGASSTTDTSTASTSSADGAATDCSSSSQAGTVNIIKHDSFGNADGLMGHQPTMIGLHYTAGNEQSVDEVVKDLSDPTGAKHCNKNCSVQLTVDPKGNVYQLTSRLDVITENIINFNDADIGIEIMGSDEQTLLKNTTQFNAVVALVTQLMKQYNIQMAQDFSNKAGLMGHMECDQWSQGHIGDHFKGTYSKDPAVESTDSHTDPGKDYMGKVRAAVGPKLGQ